MEDIFRIERETRKFRLLALLLVVAGVYFQRYAIPIWPAVALSILYLAYLSLLLFSLVRLVPVQWLPYLMLIVDTGFAAGTLYLFGVETAFVVFLPILVVYYAIYLGYAGSFLSATLISFSYIGLAYHQQADFALGRLLPVQIPLFYLIALFCGYLAQRRLQEQKERKELDLLLQAERGVRSTLDLTLSIASVLDLEQLRQQMVRIAAGAANCTHGAILLADETTGELGSPTAIFPETVANSISADEHKPDGPTQLERDALKKDHFLEIRDPKPEQLPRWVSRHAPSYVLLIPLVEGGSPIGLLWLFSTRPCDGLSAAQSNLVQSLIEFFVRLLANARAYTTAQKQSARLSSELRGAVSQMMRTQQLQKKSEVRVGQLYMEPDKEQAWFGSQRLELSAREFDVLHLLARHAGQPVSQEVLLREVWGDHGQTRRNAVDVAINRLRRKLTAQASDGDIIQTIRGAGYLLDRLATTTADPSSNTTNASQGRQPRKSQRGSLLLEHVISLAVVAVLVPALLAVLTTFVNNSDIYHDRVVSLELAQSQMESIQKEAFQPSPASYSPLSLLPSGYSIAVATGEATRYSYANGSTAPEVLQAITITVTGRYGTLQTKGHKYRR